MVISSVIGPFQYNNILNEVDDNRKFDSERLELSRTKVRSL